MPCKCLGQAHEGWFAEVIYRRGALHLLLNLCRAKPAMLSLQTLMCCHQRLPMQPHGHMRNSMYSSFCRPDELCCNLSLLPNSLICVHAGYKLHLPRAGTAPQPRPCIPACDAPAPGSGSPGSAHYRPGLAGGAEEPTALQRAMCLCSRPAGESAILAV